MINPRQDIMTTPSIPTWRGTDPAFRRSEVTARIGYGEEVWDRAASDVLLWKVKTRSGFHLNVDDAATPGLELDVLVRFGKLQITEPITVLEVIQEADRSGFSYSTRPGHPVKGEEAFIVWRKDGDVYLTVRSLTKASENQPWRLMYPLLRIAQRVVRKRYLSALR